MLSENNIVMVVSGNLTILYSVSSFDEQLVFSLSLVVRNEYDNHDNENTGFTVLCTCNSLIYSDLM